MKSAPKVQASLLPPDRQEVRDRVLTKVSEKFGSPNEEHVDFILVRESNYNPLAVNKSSGACGIVQALPCSKLIKVCGTIDKDNPRVECQAQWFADYIKNRYQTPANAVAFWKENGWY